MPLPLFRTTFEYCIQYERPTVDVPEKRCRILLTAWCCICYFYKALTIVDSLQSVRGSCKLEISNKGVAMLAISKSRLLLRMWNLLVVITPAFAQITAGIRGNVLDQSGGVVPDASVTLTNLETSLSKTTITDTAGIYSFALLPVGSYSLTVEAKGFKSYRQPNITVAVNQMLGFNVTLEVGETAQEIGRASCRER